MAIDYPGADPEQCRSRRQPHAAARARALAAALPRLVARDGAERVRNATTSICAPRSRSIREGWARFGMVQMPEYRWGIFLAEPVPDRRIGFGDAMGEPVWQQVPGEHRIEPAPPDRDPGRHRARLGRAAAPPRATLPVALRFAQPVPGQCRGRPPSLGDGLSAARLFRPRRARGGRGDAGAPFGRRRQAAHPRDLQRADRGLARASSCSPISPTATASSS